MIKKILSGNNGQIKNDIIAIGIIKNETKADHAAIFKIRLYFSTSTSFVLFDLTYIKASISVTHATLGIGGWIALIQPGLSPGKKRQDSQ
ncbi:MAG: hypothetical protein JXB88_01150 [Spirochaetales bacterium]|nr:hypothetical protein [Spirochaetales bacterium]